LLKKIVLEAKLRQLRETKGYSQEKMAEYLKISQSQYYRKERGTSKIQEKEWDILAEILEVEKNELRNNNNTPTFSTHNEESNIYSPPTISLAEQLVTELKEHVITLKEKNAMIIEQYEKRLKEKEEQILILKKR
jgi:transcriptional regulator with XRE-family HTH domain